MTKIELHVSRGAIVEGRFRSQQPGDIIDVSDREANSLVAKGRASYVTPPKPKKTKPPKPKAEGS